MGTLYGREREREKEARARVEPARVVRDVRDVRECGKCGRQTRPARLDLQLQQRPRPAGCVCGGCAVCACASSGSVGHFTEKVTEHPSVCLWETILSAKAAKCGLRRATERMRATK